jgi:hypothetical protein
MAWHDWGNTPINSTGFVPVGAGSTTTLYAELDSTMLGTVNFKPDQKMLVQVTYILGADTNVTWQVGTCNSTALANGVDEFFPKTPTGQSAQYVTQHWLFKDYRIRARQFSTGANGAAYISAVPLT